MACVRLGLVPVLPPQRPHSPHAYAVFRSVMFCSKRVIRRCCGRAVPQLPLIPCPVAQFGLGPRPHARRRHFAAAGGARTPRCVRMHATQTLQQCIGRRIDADMPNAALRSRHQLRERAARIRTCANHQCTAHLSAPLARGARGPRRSLRRRPGAARRPDGPGAMASVGPPCAAPARGAPSAVANAGLQRGAKDIPQAAGRRCRLAALARPGIGPAGPKHTAAPCQPARARPRTLLGGCTRRRRCRHASAPRRRARARILVAPAPSGGASLRISHRA